MSKNIKAINKKVYDEYADTYDRSCWARWIITWTKNFSKEIPEKSSIVDIGCGTGDVLLQLSKKNPALMAGIDISSKAAVKARGKLSKFSPDIRVGDAESPLPWPGKTFDIAVITSAIHHFPNPEKVLYEALRILKQNGKLIVAEPFFFFPILQVVNLFLKIYPHNGDFHFFSQRGLRNMIENCGFREAKQKHAGLFAKYTIAFKT